MKTRSTTLMLVFSSIFLTAQAAPRKRASFDRRPRMLAAMTAEMNRSLKQLKMKGFDLPYFIAMEMKEVESFHVRTRYGAVYRSDSDRARNLRVEVRVGSYKFDNIGTKKADYDFAYDPGYQSSNYGPLDDDPQALRNSLWLMADRSYKGALKAYLKRKSKKVTEVEEDKEQLSFSMEKPEIYTQPPLPLTFNRELWAQIDREATSIFEKHPHIFDSSVTMDAKKLRRYFTNSEGSRIITERTIYNISIFGATRADDGMLLTSQKTVYAQTESDLPNKKSIFAMVENLSTNIEALRKAPVLEPYTGPAILDGDATGVLFHEVIGHRLEGERQLDDQEGKTFKGRVGKKIVPDFLSIIDDPTQTALAGTGLNGFYRFDDEGVRASRVVLVDRGVLKSFLMSRTPVEDFQRSNGHGRSAPGQKPRARMGNTIVESTKKVPIEKLKQMLIAEVKKQGKPYGLVIKNIIGGSTHTSTWGYQAYKGMPEMVYRVFPDGREELVRGVEIVGTPIASINKIVATSDRTSIFNGYCGAESGYVPVSAAAPDVIMTEIELQRQMKKSEKSPILPSPWSGQPKK
ncbi:MAG TPA: metallopeptidase TldD-related protein [Myxococcota bacterium]|nr:metallopeptidase TldD-related protein [Myxococcota bacterium]